MGVFSAEAISKLQANTKNIRNICILAHVDHGKTTLSDYLLSSNGLISAKLSGKVRFLDSRPDEQERQITMKASSIALVYRTAKKEQRPLPLSEGRGPDHDDTVAPKAPHAPSSSSSSSPPSSSSSASVEVSPSSSAPAPTSSLDNFFLINLIDSPGHVDFSSEVSNAVRVSDGALVLVDVVEGFSVQTHAVLEKAWRDGVKPCLVLNKMDRLFTDLEMTPLEAYSHIVMIMEQINAFTATFLTAEAMEEAYKKYQEEQEKENEAKGEDASTVTTGAEDGGIANFNALEEKEGDCEEQQEEEEEKKRGELEGVGAEERVKRGRGKDKKDKKEDKKDKKGKKEKGDDKKDKKDQKDKKDNKEKESTSAGTGKGTGSSKYSVDIDEKRQLVFSPAKGNVVFCSSLDCWAFRLPQFSALYASKLGMRRKALDEALWGDYYYHPRTRDVRTAPSSENPLPLFVQLVLEPIWRMYDAVLIRQSQADMMAMVQVEFIWGEILHIYIFIGHISHILYLFISLCIVLL